MLAFVEEGHDMRLELLKYEAEAIPAETGSSLLFIHGAYHSAWCWEEHFLPFFAGQGIPSYALSLRGHGKSGGRNQLNSYGLNDYVQDVVHMLDTLGRQPILIGHSMGGAIAQKVAEQYPGRIGGMVLMSSVPPQGMGRNMLRLLLTKFRDVHRLQKYASGKRAEFPSHILFSGKLPAEQRTAWTARLQPESVKASAELNQPLMENPAKNDVPVLVLGSARDWFFTEKTAARIGSFYGTVPVIFPDMSHDMMLDPHWQAVADCILSFVQARNGIVQEGVTP